MKALRLGDRLVIESTLRQSQLNMDWWMWVLAGFVLLAIEMASPGGFYVFFFGVGALAVGLLTALGVTETIWLQGVLITVLSVVSLLCFRRPILKKMHVHAPTGDIDSFVGERAVVHDEIGPGGLGKAELRGSTWNARNAGEAPIGRDQSCRVERVDGLTLWVRAE